jgi:ApbE superfamily uncharacterized protein (UPF0280 family)
MSAQASFLPDGKRLHLNHGPIDLIIEAFGPPAEVTAAYAQATTRFETILTELAAELPRLRAPNGPQPQSPTAKRMTRAIVPHAEQFVTPMAAVAGAVADEILAALTQNRKLTRAYVNNGGDSALHIGPNATLTVAGPQGTRITLHHTSPVRGIATSGWGGRSLSRGIADAVTVLAPTAAAADVAATLIANAVNINHPCIQRQPANTLDPDSDLGPRLITTDVPPLTSAQITTALQNGLQTATAMQTQGLIHQAHLSLQSHALTTSQETQHA